MPDSSPRDARPFDLILLGATGFTGRLVAEHLARTPSLRWALAGRNLARLEGVRADLARAAPHLAELPLLKVDTSDARAVGEMAAATRVVCTTVGPYDLLGEPVVAACAEHGTDYCDLTGEVPFVRRMIDGHHARASETGARIVHCCGFDSIPSDLGTWFLQQESMTRHGAPATEVRFTLEKVKGGFSGGTVASLMNVVKQLKDPAVRKVVGHAYALNPEGERRGPDRGDLMRPARVRGPDGADVWVGPFLMAPVNTRVVRRSHALLGWPWGRDFRYSEVQRFGKGLRGLAMASAVSAALVGFMGAVSVAPLRRLLEDKVLPAPGEGPDAEARERGSFRARLVGTTEDGRRTEVVVTGRGDPGYGATARMLGETALALAFDPKPDGALASGILTPSTALGGALVARLAAEDIRFEAR
jgi:short subunit dehydrogenase-like uncharacterized protein